MTTERNEDAQVRLICSMCSQPYFAAVGTNPGECVSCVLARAEAESRQAAHERKQAQRRAVGKGVTNWLGARVIAGLIALIMVGAFLVIQRVRKDADERHRADASRNVYVIKTANLKWRMCHCEDFECAKQAKADFEAWKASEPAPSNDVKRAAKSEEDALFRCYNQLL